MAKHRQHLIDHNTPFEATGVSLLQDGTVVRPVKNWKSERESLRLISDLELFEATIALATFSASIIPVVGADSTVTRLYNSTFEEIRRNIAGRLT